MKMELLYSIVVLLGVVFLFVTWRVLNWVWFRPKKLEKLLRKQGLNGNSYRFLFGDMKDMNSMLKLSCSKPINLSDEIISRVVPHFQETVKKYGKDSFFWLGPKPTVLIMNHDLIKEVTLKYVTYEKPHSNPLTRLLAQGIVSLEGDKWAKHRKIINPAFHQEKLKHMIPAFYASASDMLSKWEDIVCSKGLSEELDIWPYLQTLTSDAISRTAFGSNYEEGRRIFELQREQAQHFMVAVRKVYVPGWRFMPTKRNRRMKEIAKTVDNSICHIIEARMKARKAGENSEDDLLSILLESNSKEIDQHGSKDFGMSIQEVIDECKLFYFAGQETTSVLLVWTMILLSKHREWQDRARKEVLNLFGTNEPDFDGLNHLKIVTMILNEVLRLYPPLSSISRRTAEEVKLGNLTLPAGVMVTLPIMLIHYDSTLWGDDVKEFNPKRFAEGVSHATKGQVTFFPFGWGPRICVGQNFAMLEAKLVMAMILQRFSFELSPSYAHAPTSIVTLQPQHGAHLILRKL